MIKITKNVNEANAITHGGTFHGDDVMATVILKKALGDLTICRVFDVPDAVPRNAIIYDIGGGPFDHHQKDGNGKRPNGVPYASCGLVWRSFSHGVLKDVNIKHRSLAWSLVDKELISGIDAIDNADLPRFDYPARVMSVSGAISSFNPTWDSDESSDSAFIRAVEFAEIIFDNHLKNVIAKVKALDVVDEKISNSSNGIMVLDTYVPWQEHILYSQNPKASKVLFVIFPSNRGGYNVQAVSKGFGTNECRKLPPRTWWGASPLELRKITGVKTAKFCHAKNGFIFASETLEDALNMAKLAIKS